MASITSSSTSFRSSAPRLCRCSTPILRRSAYPAPPELGETLIVSANGLGPTTPGVDPGQPFPATPLQEVNSLLGVAVNGRAAVVLNRVGWPGTTGVYRVDFRVPDGTAANVASVQISAAWIQGPETKIAVQ